MSKVAARILHSSEPKINYTAAEVLKLRGNSRFSEAWLHDRIAENPELLGLGPLVLLDKERRQPKAGRLDLLLEHEDNRRRFEVEVQLGPIDESHIIRTIEYWDNERKRYPQYDHCAVIIAEEITGRFLNVLSLFNGHIPLIALQVKLLKVGDHSSLFFTRVLDEVRLGEDDPREEARLETNREYWETKSSVDSMRRVDQLHALVESFAPGFELKYNKFFIGLYKEGRAQNFLAFKPQRAGIRIELKMELDVTSIQKLEDVGIEVMPYAQYWSVHPIRVTEAQIKEHRNLLIEIFQKSFDTYFE